MEDAGDLHRNRRARLVARHVRTIRSLTRDLTNDTQLRGQFIRWGLAESSFTLLSGIFFASPFAAIALDVHVGFASECLSAIVDIRAIIADSSKHSVPPEVIFSDRLVAIRHAQLAVVHKLVRWPPLNDYPTWSGLGEMEVLLDTDTSSYLSCDVRTHNAAASFFDWTDAVGSAASPVVAMADALAGHTVAPTGLSGCPSMALSYVNYVCHRILAMTWYSACTLPPNSDDRSLALWLTEFRDVVTYINQGVDEMVLSDPDLVVQVAVCCVLTSETSQAAELIIQLALKLDIVNWDRISVRPGVPVRASKMWSQLRFRSLVVLLHSVHWGQGTSLSVVDFRSMTKPSADTSAPAAQGRPRDRPHVGVSQTDGNCHDGVSKCHDEKDCVRSNSITTTYSRDCRPMITEAAGVFVCHRYMPLPAANNCTSGVSGVCQIIRQRDGRPGRMLSAFVKSQGGTLHTKELTAIQAIIKRLPNHNIMPDFFGVGRIITGTHSGIRDGYKHLLMRQAGGTLADLWRSHPKTADFLWGVHRGDGTPHPYAVQEPDFAAIVTSLFAAVAALHTADITHGDLKPSNIVVTASPRINLTGDSGPKVSTYCEVRLIDWNVSEVSGSEVSRTGTPGYTAHGSLPTLPSLRIDRKFNDVFALVMVECDLVRGCSVHRAFAPKEKKRPLGAIGLAKYPLAHRLAQAHDFKADDALSTFPGFWLYDHKVLHFSIYLTFSSLFSFLLFSLFLPLLVIFSFLFFSFLSSLLVDGSVRTRS